MILSFSDGNRIEVDSNAFSARLPCEFYEAAEIKIPFEFKYALPLLNDLLPFNGTDVVPMFFGIKRKYSVRMGGTTVESFNLDRALDSYAKTLVLVDDFLDETFKEFCRSSKDTVVKVDGCIYRVFDMGGIPIGYDLQSYMVEKLTDGVSEQLSHITDAMKSGGPFVYHYDHKIFFEAEDLKTIH